MNRNKQATCHTRHWTLPKHDRWTRRPTSLGHRHWGGGGLMGTHKVKTTKKNRKVSNRWRCMGLGGGGRTLKYTYPLGAVVDIRVFCLLYTFNLSQPVFVSTTYHPRRPCPPLADPHTAPWPLLTPRDKGSPPHSVRARVTRCTHAADLQGGHFSHWCSFPEPTARASHSQRRRTGRGVRP
jgi:hypothetical protein